MEQNPFMIVSKQLASARSDYLTRKRKAESMATCMAHEFKNGFSFSSIFPQIVPHDFVPESLMSLAEAAGDLVRYEAGKGWCFQIALCCETGANHIKPNLCFIIPFIWVDQPDSPFVLRCELDLVTECLESQPINLSEQDWAWKVSEFAQRVVSQVAKVTLAHNPVLPHGTEFTTNQAKEVLVINLGVKPAAKCCCYGAAT